MNMRQHAEALANQGFRVLPLHWPQIYGQLAGLSCSCGNPECSSVGKHPLTFDGSKGATFELAQVQAWWERWPSANIGIATGYEDSVDVIDIDGPEGQAAMRDYVKLAGQPRTMAVARTGRHEGWHMYVTPGGQQNWTGGFGGHPKGLDVKGRGGYVVAPPSLHASGKRYEWVNEPDANLTVGVDWPKWHAHVREYVALGLLSDAPADELRIVQPWSQGAGTGLKFVDAVCERVRNDVASAGEGARWQTLAMVGIWDMAGLVQSGQLTEYDALAILEELGAELGLDRGELSRIPRELGRALAKRHTPIAPRATPTAPTATPGVHTLPDAGADAVAATAGADPVDAQALEDYEIFRRAAHYRIEFLARQKAQDDIKRAELGERPWSEPLSLDELLERPREVTRYRIEGLWPVNGRALLAAQFKAGKTTLVGNVIRAVADNSRFLSRYQATQPEGTIALIDTELSPTMLQDWLRDQAIGNTAKVWVTPLRGLNSSFDITDDLIRARWVHALKERHTEVVVLDCLGPVLAALGLDENKNVDVGKFISAFEALLNEAGVCEALVIHHMGHVGERARGSSRLRDWPDVEWQLVREGQEDDTAPDASVPRYFRAYGRDVNVPEQLLTYDSDFRWLSVTGELSNRKAIKADRARDEMRAQITAAVREEPGISTRNIVAMVRGRRESIYEAVRDMVEARTLVAVSGPNRVMRHYLPDYVPPGAVPSGSNRAESPATLIDLGKQPE